MIEICALKSHVRYHCEKRPLGSVMSGVIAGVEVLESLAPQWDPCGGECRDLHDCDAMCINKSSGHLHQPQEEPDRINSDLCFRLSESKNTTSPFPSCNTKLTCWYAGPSGSSRTW